MRYHHIKLTSSSKLEDRTSDYHQQAAESLKFKPSPEIQKHPSNDECLCMAHNDGGSYNFD